MHFDIGQLVGLVAMSAAASVVVMSYVAAYMVGRHRGRRDAEREAEMRAAQQGDAYARSRLDQLETTVSSLGSSIKQLGDAQRVWVDYQDRAARRERNQGSPRTPA